jgi:surfeit locus 1 family protein
MLRLLFNRDHWWLTLLVAAAAAVCARLGIWQLDRLAQRRQFNAHVSAVQAMPPLQLPSTVDLTTMEYRAVRASGVYDFGLQVAIRDQYNGNEYGYHLVTPLKLAEGGAVLVDRGWIPAAGNASPADWRQYDEQGAVSVRGIVRLGQTLPSPGGEADPTLAPGQNRLDLWFYVNIDRVGAQLPYPILPIYIQLDPDPTQVDPPIAYQPALDLSEGPHASYAIQWFSFATIMLIGYPAYLFRQENMK